jgi:uncharacterized protein (TIGR02596 family)
MELLVILVIILILIGLSVPLSQTVGNADLQQGIEMLHGKISLARQTAIRENTAVEVRFYFYNDPRMPGDEEQFRALQYVKYEVEPGGEIRTAVPLSKIEKLPGNIIIMNHPDYSTLVTASELEAGEPVEIDKATGDASYYAFSFLPDGSADLRDEVAGAWFLTIVEESKLSETGTELPRNFITLQIEPFTGAIRRLQPQAG